MLNHYPLYVVSPMQRTHRLGRCIDYMYSNRVFTNSVVASSVGYKHNGSYVPGFPSDHKCLLVRFNNKSLVVPGGSRPVANVSLKLGALA